MAIAAQGTRLRAGVLLALFSAGGALRLSPQCLRVPSHPRSRPLAMKAVNTADSMVSSAMEYAAPCGQWELDFYSRPVQGPDGKKLWELLVTDSSGTFRHIEVVPSNCVNSRELRSRVQRLIDSSEVKPTSVRFFRVQMKNMISIALNELPGVECKPSRVTYRLNEWLEVRAKALRTRRHVWAAQHPRLATHAQPASPISYFHVDPSPLVTPCRAQSREREVYPTMAGYRKPRPEAQAIKLPVKLPEQLRGEQVRCAPAPPHPRRAAWPRDSDAAVSLSGFSLGYASLAKPRAPCTNDVFRWRFAPMPGVAPDRRALTSPPPPTHPVRLRHAALR